MPRKRRIRRPAILSAALTFLVLSAGAAFAQAPIPDTPAGRTLRSWLDAFNSGDRAQIQAYIQKIDPKKSLDGMLAFRRQTGGFDLLAIESSQPLLIRFRVKEKASTTMGIGSLEVKDGQPPTVESFGLHAIPPGAKLDNVKLDAAARQRVIDSVIQDLNEYYVYPDLATKMAAAVQQRARSGAYDSISDGDAFAGALTDDLRAVSHDKHLHVGFSPFKLPPEQHGPNPQEEAEFHKELEKMNCGFEKIEILPRNIGYLKFNMFADADFCGSTAVAAMNFLAHTDAIIYDLRENGGGDPKMVALMASYLFDKPTHLNDLYNRKEDETTQYWTLPYVPGARLGDKPAFVLTSKSTFSGAEEFAYDLKCLKRATIVGETTGGGAHPVAGHRVDDHFMIGVPFARAINPVTKTNWEGTGVQPDVAVKAADALDTAEKLAGEKIPAK
jgi:hypothetical protein